MDTQYHPAKVDQQQLSEIQALEDQLGTVVVAMDSQQNSYADLDEKQLAELQAAEKKMGMVMLAFDR